MSLATAFASPQGAISERLGQWLVARQDPVPGQKTMRWSLYPSDQGRPIAYVRWYAPWRCYALQAFSNTVYEQDCLRAIAEFCERKTREHREQRRAGASGGAAVPGLRA